MSGNNGEATYELTLALPAVHRGVRVARNVVRHFSRLWGMTDREVDSLVLVVSELLGNTIDHGGGGAALTENELVEEARMRLSFVIRQRDWTVQVTDQGGGDPETIRRLIAPDGMPDLEDERGRGFFLLAQMVDSMEVEKSADGRGLTITATKGHGE